MTSKSTHITFTKAYGFGFIVGFVWTLYEPSEVGIALLVLVLCILFVEFLREFTDGAEP